MRLVMLPPYVAPEHRPLVEEAEKILRDYDSSQLDKIKNDLFGKSGAIAARPEDIRAAEVAFYDDPFRKALINNLCRIKSICEQPRLMLSAT